jgi:hypothetical protein
MESSVTAPTVIYIAGYGRSGSTALDIILGNHSEIASAGEVGLMLEDWSNRRCSCGRAYADCNFWKGLFPNSAQPAQLVHLVRKLEKAVFIPRLLLGLVTDDDRQAYSAYQRKIFLHIRSRTGKRFVVDSSKSARTFEGRFWALHKLVGQDIYVVHLVRDGLATLESLCVTGSNWAIVGYTSAPKLLGWRAAYGWLSANLWAFVLGRLLMPNRYIMIRYEDFLTDPTSTLRSIGKLCGFDPEELIQRVDSDQDFSVGHLVGGNRIRFQEKIKLHRNVRQRCETHPKPHQRLPFMILAGWLNRLYGYR